MRKSLFVIFNLLTPLLLVVSAASCRNHGLVKGDQLERTSVLDGFNKVEASQVVEVIYEQCSSCQIRLEGDEEALAITDVRVADSTLYLSMRSNTTAESMRLKAYVGSPDLKTVELSGVARFQAPGKVKLGDVSMAVFGASSFSMSHLECRSLDLDVSGVSSASVAGDVAGSADIDTSGSSQVNFAGRIGDRLLLNSDGISDVRVSATVGRAATVDAGGSSTCYLKLSAVPQVRLDGGGMSSGTAVLEGCGDVTADVTGFARFSLSGDVKNFSTAATSDRQLDIDRLDIGKHK